MPKRRRGHGWSCVGRKRSKHVMFSIHPKETLVKKSSIESAGLGLFLCESVKKGERVAVYSGEELNLNQRLMFIGTQD